MMGATGSWMNGKRSEIGGAEAKWSDGKDGNTDERGLFE